MATKAVPTDHAGCAEYLRHAMRVLGCEVTVSSTPPLVLGPYTEGFRCPHGVDLCFEPTGEQIAAWVREGVR